MVYIIGALQQYNAPLKANLIEASMNGMQQKVYFPPNVSGWEGGLSWLNTNTVQARFGTIATVQRLRYSNYYSGSAIDMNSCQGHQTCARNPSATTAAAWVDTALETSTPHQSRRRPRGGDRDLRRHADHPEDSPRRCAGNGSTYCKTLILSGPNGTGDVTCAVLECEEIERTRVRDQRSPQDAADPVPRRSTASPPVAPPSHLTRRRLMPWGVAGLRVRLRRPGARLGVVWESVAQAADRARQNSLVLLYLAGSK